MVVVVVGVVGVVVVGVVGVVCATEHADRDRDRGALRCACVPAAGLCLSTIPTWLGSVVVAVTIFGVNPARPSAAAASVSFCPTTFGTATSLGALRHHQVHLAAGTQRAAGGRRLRQHRSGRLAAETCWVIVPTARPAVTSAASAAARVWPTVSGTRDRRGTARDEHRHGAARPATWCRRRVRWRSRGLRRPIALGLRLGRRLEAGRAQRAHRLRRGQTFDLAERRGGRAARDQELDAASPSSRRARTAAPRRTRRRWRRSCSPVDAATGVSPARLSRTIAASSVSPMTSGTLTRPDPGQQHDREHRQPTTSTAAAADHSSTRRRRSPGEAVGLLVERIGRRQQQRAGGGVAAVLRRGLGGGAGAPSDSGRARRSCWSAAMNSSASA